MNPNSRACGHLGVINSPLEALKAGRPITGKDSVLSPLIKQLTEAALEAEIDTHLAQEVAPNRKNGKSRKTMKSSSGSFELDTPRDRAGSFEILLFFHLMFLHCTLAFLAHLPPPETFSY